MRTDRVRWTKSISCQVSPSYRVYKQRQAREVEVEKGRLCCHGKLIGKELATACFLGSRVWSLGFGVWGLGLRVEGLEIRVWGLGFGV